MSVLEERYVLSKGKNTFEHADTLQLLSGGRVELKCVGGLRVIEREE